MAGKKEKGSTTPSAKGAVKKQATGKGAVHKQSMYALLINLVLLNIIFVNNHVKSQLLNVFS